ncbi:PD-(D/E)XK nuclease family protein [Rhodococcoides kyotonense]|uniref:CRISPR/Cas system-associated exonuclease Cas4, RecB family n=1 Tax=Rhodococcoides kyotonense TaxID=398843 RepID=A0A239FL29_9NOCA|nr:PD-(D/E)XK nuclease family protein [Rhodococcus kyotonensis]SNS57575.1 CRISPR/Cas system-associated exonuclease Cas4, RecB family [Rhodococcus kyotonensis]
MTDVHADLDLSVLAGELEDAVNGIWDLADADHERSTQAEIGVSEIGQCERRAGYRMTATPKTDPVAPSRPALLGTWIHEKALPLIADLFGGDVEVTVSVDGVLGHSDLIRPVSGAVEVIVDLKTCTQAKLSKVRAYGPPRGHKWQTNLYAEARRQAGATVAMIGLVYLDRALGDTEVWCARPDPEVTAQARQWIRDVRNADDPDLLPRGGRGPGHDWICNDCAWRTRCFPEGVATIITEGGDDAVRDAAQLHYDAGQREAAAKKDKKFASALLAGVTGVHGAYQVSQRPTGRRLDQKQAKTLLAGAGLEIPMGEASSYPVVNLVEPDSE